MLIDSHCHLDLLDLDRLELSLDDIVASAKATSVNRMLTVGINLSDAQRVIEMQIVTRECTAQLAYTQVKRYRLNL